MIPTNGRADAFYLPRQLKKACERPPHAQWARPAGHVFLVALEPAARREIGGDAGSQQHEAEGNGPDDPARLELALEHEAVEQSQDENQNCRLGKESRTTMRRDGDQIEECRCGLPWNDPAA